MREIHIPAMSAEAFVVGRGESVRIIDVAGGQGGDFVAFNAEDLSDKFSQARTRVENHKFNLTTGDRLWTNAPAPTVMFTISADTCGGHSLLYTPCCRYALELRFGVSREGCHEHLVEALKPWKIAYRDIPDPMSVFFNVESDAAGGIAICKPTSKAGDHIDMKAEMTCIVAVSTCSVPRADKANSPYLIEIFE